MNATGFTCAQCGAALAPGTKFCANCGAPVDQAAATTPQPAAQRFDDDPFALPVTTEPARTTPQATAPVMPPPPVGVSGPPPARRSPLWWILGGGCLLLFCLFVGGFVILSLLRPQVGQVFSGIVESLEPTTASLPDFATATPEILLIPTQPEEELLATATPAIILIPTQPATETAQPSATPATVLQPTQAAPALALTWPAPIGQQKSATSLTDDFTDNTFDWAIDADEVSTYALEDGHYAMTLSKTQYSIWAYLPVDFHPSTIRFDAAVLPGQDVGAYGVLCFYQDPDNYYSVSIDPVNREYSMGQVLNGDWVSSQPQDWMPAQGLLDSPSAVNSVQITCAADQLALSINNQPVAQASISAPAGERAALMLESWDQLAPDGFKVLFDNLSASQ